MLEQNQQLTAFNELVATKYQLFNGLFMTLPFPDMPAVGAELSVFNEICHNGLLQAKTPVEIIQGFLKNIVHTKKWEQSTHILSLLLQFVERQVVLFDALEDTAFEQTHHLGDEGSLSQLLGRLSSLYDCKAFYKLLQTYKARIVLTAHPTQFYPPQILSIIESLSAAVKDNQLQTVQDILLQLGKTSFRNATQPTPLDEAHILMHYLEQVFYPVYTDIHFDIYQSLQRVMAKDEYLPAVVELGFWPGGDRDGNPNVTADITRQVAHDLKFSILARYEKELEQLKQRLTFPHMWEQLDAMINRVIATKQMARSSKGLTAEPYQQSESLVADLIALKHTLQTEHQSLFTELVDRVIVAVKTFGFYFASVDLRQDSRVHGAALQRLFDCLIKSKALPENLQPECQHYSRLSSAKKSDLLCRLLALPKIIYEEEWLDEDAELNDIMGSLQAARKIQAANGEQALHRYIISNSTSAYHVLEVALFAYWSGWSTTGMTLDIVPLFESVKDLKNSQDIMRQLYQNRWYRQHLSHRHDKQVIMLGFSDGTKDGGYLMANWQILSAKRRLAALAEECALDVIFFDGRGGPPARGGGNTHKFYRAIEHLFTQHQIHLTIQGQTISTKFTNRTSASHHVEQLFTSAIQERLFTEEHEELTAEDLQLLDDMAERSYIAYLALKSDPLFVAYLEEVTPLKFYGELNIASRPPRRKREGAMQFDDLRAIPFVGAWSQMKQNVPGFYGLGTALKQLTDIGKEEELNQLYRRSLFFRTLLQNAMQSLAKSNFDLTRYLEKDKRFGRYWKQLQAEAVLTKEMLQSVSGQLELLDDDPVLQHSIKLREKMVLPLLVIQQYAMMELRQNDSLTKAQKETLHRLVLKSLAANINASRNSA